MLGVSLLVGSFSDIVFQISSGFVFLTLFLFAEPNYSWDGLVENSTFDYWYFMSENWAPFLAARF